MGLHPKLLSRSLKDGGTLSSPLIPWNTCGAYMIGVLGLQPWTYVPFCFMNLINPVIAVSLVYLGIKIAKVDYKGAVEK
jgi:NhaC family Na+:H+ antiporter